MIVSRVRCSARTLVAGGKSESPHSLAAAQTEILHRHTSETLLRRGQAHAPEDGCPWLAMSRVTAPTPFK